MIYPHLSRLKWCRHSKGGRTISAGQAAHKQNSPYRAVPDNRKVVIFFSIYMEILKLNIDSVAGGEHK
ncbi:hypothetical protein BK147_07610 [Paenibacillus sp. FSL R7-0337]|nr:hypothetical protein C162_11701 [Paenibacillus sp. FSL R7-269]OMF99430.1 hypothetical protein BK147_07610 [Paenibacillus sp. FSL R7-0337]